MTPESFGLQLALTFVALLLAALGALMLFKGAREDADAPRPDLTDARVRIGDGASVLRFRLEVQPSGRTAFRAEKQVGTTRGSEWPGRARRTCAS